MNKRICELKEAAMEVTFSSPSTGREQKQLNVDKFAELIVRECINICKDIADPHLYRNQDMHQRMAPGASYAAKLIETRFSELKNEL